MPDFPARSNCVLHLGSSVTRPAWRRSMQKMNSSTAMPGSRIGKVSSGSLLPTFLLAAGYYLGAKIGFALTFDPAPVSILWPPNAVLLAGLLMNPPHAWGLILLAVFPVHLVTQLQSGVPFAMVLGWFVSNCSEALLGAVCVRSILGERLRFDSFQHVAVFLFSCVFLAPFASTFLDVAFVKMLGWGTGSFWQLWRLRFFSNVVAMLMIVPVLLAWHAGILSSMRNAAFFRRLEGGLFVFAFMSAGAMVFISRLESAGFVPVLLYAPLPILLWAAVRFEPFVVSASFLLFAFLAIWGTLRGYGPFVEGAYDGNVLSLQLFLIGVSVPLLLLSAALQERRKSQKSLHRQEEKLKLALAAGRIRAENEVRKQREQLTHLARVALLGELSGAFAHELNQPLATILTNAQAARRFMSQQPIDLNEIREILDDIVEEDRRAGAVIRHLRALFMKSEVKMQPLEINELARDTLALTHSDLIARAVPADLQPSSSSCMVRGDRVQLQQVLLNLIVNACEAMSGRPPQTRRLTLTITDKDSSGNVRISVTDTGPGIAPNVIDKIFDTFFTTKAHGMGFGLSVSRTIILEHGGRIEAGNHPGGGATFQVTLPAAQEACHE